LTCKAIINQTRGSHTTHTTKQITTKNKQTGDYGGMWSGDDALAAQLEAAAKAKGEKLWRMPLAEEYKPNIKSEIADLKNVGGRVRCRLCGCVCVVVCVCVTERTGAGRRFHHTIGL
jgi:hypothetical protein